MPIAKVYNLAGDVVGEVELSDRVFAATVNGPLLHQAVVAYEANQRSGLAQTKTRANVRGGGRKPWRQKGTGRARAGSTRAPHWRHGGVAFGPHPRDYTQKFPRKMRRAAIRQALSSRMNLSELVVFDNLNMDKPRTRDIIEALNRLDIGKNVLIVTRRPVENLKLSVRNLPDVKATTADSLNVYSLLKYHRVVLDRDAVSAVEEVFGS